MLENTLIKKIGGNWHKIQIWKEWIIGYKSGGVVIVNPNIPGIKEHFIPFYHFSDFIIDNDNVFIRDKEDQLFQIDLLRPGNLIKLNMASKNEIEKEKPRAIDGDEKITAVAYMQKGIDFFQTGSREKITHFDFPGYSFIDDIRLQGNRLYAADVFGLRILDISDIEQIILDDRFTAFKGWPKDVASYKHYLLVADVLGIKIYDKNKGFEFVGKIETNRNRVAKVETKGDYAFLSCEAVGLKVVDLSDIKNPRLVSGIALPKGVWDCDVYEEYAYLAAYTGGLLKIDCANIKNLKQVCGYTGDEEIIGVHVNERAVYAACSHDGIKIFDHQLNPVSAVKGIPGRCWTIIERDGYIYIASGKGGVSVYDVKNLEKPAFVNRIETIEARDLFINDRFLYIADGQNGALIYNISDPLNVEYINKIPSAAFTRGIMADEEYIYKADGDGGVEIYENYRCALSHS